MATSEYSLTVSYMHTKRCIKIEEVLFDALQPRLLTLVALNRASFKHNAVVSIAIRRQILILRLRLPATMILVSKCKSSRRSNFHIKVDFHVPYSTTVHASTQMIILHLLTIPNLGSFSAFAGVAFFFLEARLDKRRSKMKGHYYLRGD